jgi:SAM-dependent methyltransferase
MLRSVGIRQERKDTQAHLRNAPGAVGLSLAAGAACGGWTINPCTGAVRSCEHPFMPNDFELLNRPDRYPRSSKYEPGWILSLDMGPHPLWQLEDLLTDLDLQPGSKVLDLGCGKGATSVFLANECDVDVVAFDLWIPEDELRRNIVDAGAGDRVTVVRGSALDLPFADDEFDAVISVDSYEYFGTDVHFLPALLRVIKPSGRLGVSTPALRVDPYLVEPPAYVTEVVGWEAACWHAPSWWATHWQLSGLVEDIQSRLQEGGREDWLLWSQALGDQDAATRRMLLADEDGQIGFALITATKR